MKFKEPKAIYLQIADRLCDEILTGRYAPEARIPSVREYAAVVEVNSNTVVRSFDVKNGRRIKIERFDKKYFVSFQNRNDKHAEHLLITNGRI